MNKQVKTRLENIERFVKQLNNSGNNFYQLLIENYDNDNDIESISILVVESNDYLENVFRVNIELKQVVSFESLITITDTEPFVNDFNYKAKLTKLQHFTKIMNCLNELVEYIVK